MHKPLEGERDTLIVIPSLSALDICHGCVVKKLTDIKKVLFFFLFLRGSVSPYVVLTDLEFLRSSDSACLNLPSS